MRSFSAALRLRKQKRRLHRYAQREVTSRLTSRLNASSDSEDETDRHDLSTDVETVQQTSVNTSHITKEYINDDFDKSTMFVTDDTIDDHSSPLFHGSKHSVQAVVHRFISAFVDMNLDKQTSTRLLVLVKDILPQPNKLPTTWKRLMRKVGHETKCITSFLCGECHQL